MKRIILSLFAALGAVTAFAQSIPLLDKVPDHRVEFDYVYYLAKDGKPEFEVTSGKVTVEDNAYAMTGLGLEVYSDGNTRVSVDHSASEVLIETVEEEDLFTNPALFIGAYKQYTDRIKVNRSGKDYLDVSLTLDDDAVCRFSLSNIQFLDKKGDMSDFKFDTLSVGKDFLVTDLR